MVCYIIISIFLPFFGGPREQKRLGGESGRGGETNDIQWLRVVLSRSVKLHRYM